MERETQPGTWGLVTSAESATGPERATSIDSGAGANATAKQSSHHVKGARDVTGAFDVGYLVTAVDMIGAVSNFSDSSRVRRPSGRRLRRAVDVAGMG